MMSKKTVFNWSSGKDSAMALFHLQNDPNVKVSHLITTINKHHDRVTMHGTPVSLLKEQLRSLGLPYSLVELPESPSMEAYEVQIGNIMSSLKSNGIIYSAYGDIFLEDLKIYREKEMKKIGLECLFPIWKRSTTELIKEFIDLGFKAKIVCANDQLGTDFLGREIDYSFLSDLPVNIDPCGENGEFHTFCYDGPLFNSPIHFDLGEKVKRSYPNPVGDGTTDFWFVDLIQKDERVVDQ